MGEWETGAKAVVTGADAAAMRKAAVVESFMVVLFYEIQTKQWRILHHGASACLHVPSIFNSKFKDRES